MKLTILKILCGAFTVQGLCLCANITRSIPFNLPVLATSVHWTSTGDLDSNSPVLIRQGNNDVPYDSSVLGGTDNNFVNWNDPPGAGRYFLVFSTRGTPIKNVNFWYDYPGIPAKINGPADQIVAGLYINFGPNGASIFAENAGSAAVPISSIVATVVDGTPDLINANWENATGVNFTFAGLTAAPGDTADFVGMVSAQPNQWIKLSANIGGSTDILAATVATPEPSTLALLSAGALFCLMARRHHGTRVLRQRPRELQASDCPLQ